MEEPSSCVFILLKKITYGEEICTRPTPPSYVRGHGHDVFHPFVPRAPRKARRRRDVQCGSIGWAWTLPSAGVEFPLLGVFENQRTSA